MLQTFTDQYTIDGNQTIEPYHDKSQPQRQHADQPFH